MNHLKENKGRAIAGSLGVILFYFFSRYWFSGIKPEGIMGNAVYLLTSVVLIQGSVCLGEKYIDKKK
jgi:hypothetical protein